MQVVYLNTNGFCGIGDKHSHYRNNEKIANANQILSKILNFQILIYCSYLNLM